VGSIQAGRNCRGHGGFARWAQARRYRLAVVLLAGGGLALAGCTGAHPASQESRKPGQAAPATGTLPASAGRLVDEPVASTGCGRRPAVRPGSTARLTVAVPPASAAGARRRTLWLHVPAQYVAGHRTPLVLAFHGSGGTSLGMEHGSGLSALADRQGFLVAYPQGMIQNHGRGPQGWDASGPHDPWANGIDDGLYISDVLTALQASYCVDPTRIAATGMSNGASMTGYLACVLAGRIAAFAPVEGVFFQIPGGCRPTRPAAIINVHVLTEPVAPYAGVPSRGSPDYYAPAIPAWLQAWARRDGCRGGPRPLTGLRQITGQSWGPCPGGGSITGYRLATGGHTWFGAIGVAAGDSLILRFFAAHPLRGAPPAWAPGPTAVVPVLTAPRPAIRSLRQFHLPTPGAEPFDIAAGPGGSMWFTEFHGDKIGRISPSGAITEFRVPTPGAGPYEIAAGPGGSMWFTEYRTTKIGRVTSHGQVTEIQLPQPSYGGAGITGSGPAGPAWVADAAGFIDRITGAGTVTRIRAPPSGGIPFAITRSDQAKIWFSELTGYFEYSRQLLQLRAGSGSPAPALTLASGRSNIDALATGPAGTVWLADFGTSQVGELSPAGRLRLLGDGAPYSGLSDIAAGLGGSAWFSEQAGFIGRVAPDGTVSELALPAAGSNPDGIAAGPGRTVWVTETGTGAIARVTLP